MGNDDVGEHSRKSYNDNSNNDDYDDYDRPLKKAKYVWQVKGKYHLKQKFHPNQSNSGKNLSSQSSKSLGNFDRCDINQNSASIINNNNQCRGRCCVQKLLAHSNAIVDDEESSEDEAPSKNIEKSISDEIPVTLVKPNLKNQDYYLQRWQARQVAKGFVDNTINRVLESWMISPFDADDFVENCENDGQIEDESILMAIQSHGLQSSVNMNNPEMQTTSTPFLVTPEIAESTLDNFQNIHNELLKDSGDDDIVCSSYMDSDLSLDESESIEDSMELQDHTNFLDAAVSVAIQKKGLSSQNFN